MANFLFDEEGHSYTLDSHRLPSVTQIIDGALNPYTGVPAYFLERARLYGQAVHKTTELYLKDDLDEESLDKGLVKPLEAFKVWLMDYPEFAERTPVVEVPRYHTKLMYAGTPDLDYPGLAVVDIKSRPVNRLTDGMQTAAYDNFEKGNRNRYVLELKQDGTYTFTLLNRTKKEGAESWHRFRYLLDYHNMKQQISFWR